jgi:hypothetical protein
VSSGNAPAPENPPRCPNGHNANSNHECSDASCPYRADLRHDGANR